MYNILVTNRKFGVEEQTMNYLIAYIGHQFDILSSTIMKVGSSPRECYLVSSHDHPVLVRLLCCEMGVRDIYFPDFVSASRPFDRDLDRQSENSD